MRQQVPHHKRDILSIKDGAVFLRWQSPFGDHVNVVAVCDQHRLVVVEGPRGVGDERTEISGGRMFIELADFAIRTEFPSGDFSRMEWRPSVYGLPVGVIVALRWAFSRLRSTDRAFGIPCPLRTWVDRMAKHPDDLEDIQDVEVTTTLRQVCRLPV